MDQTKLRAQVERLAASAEFARADRMVQFLRYVVEKTLDGDTAALRERQIGVAVFERPSDWDPKLDNVVRSEARRLRSKLEAYAASDDPDETVRITMPTGGYGVQFEELSVPTAPTERPADSLTQDTTEVVEVPASTLNLPPDHRKPAFAKRPWVLLVSVVSLLAVLVAVLHYRSGARARDDQYEVAPFSSEVGLQFSPAISPDSKAIAFVWNGGTNQYDIYLKQMGSPDSQRLTHDIWPSIHPAWSPDGKQIAFLRQAGDEAQLMVLDLSTHRERLIRRMQDSRPDMWGISNGLASCQTLSWSKQGDQIYLTDPSDAGHGLVSISTQTGDQKAVSKPTGADQDCYARPSPDGRTFAFVRFLSHASGYVYTVEITGDHLRRLTQEVRELRGVDWTPDGKHLIFASKENGAYQLRMISANGGESSLLPSATESAADPSVSPDGAFVAFVESHDNWNLWQVRLDGDRIGVPERLIASTGQNHSPSFSPDGHTITFVSDRSGSPEIWAVDSRGQHLRQLTHFGGPWLGTIRWSPDGKFIVFDARPKGHSAIYRLSIGGGDPILVEDQPFELRRPSWSRDGRYIYFDSSRRAAPEIWKRDLQTNEDHVVAPAGFYIGIESLDGKQLFYQDLEQRYVWVSDTDGSSPKRLTEVHPTPDLAWTPVNHGICFASSISAGKTDVFVFDLDTRKLRKLGQINQDMAPGTPSFVVSPDGKTLLYAAVDNRQSEIKLRRGALLH
ncbi:LpqB family beta-propeller domain-containing protein [Granulicella sp. L60]|uniref:LpqB family beta-propeller domain-containing protein n=1 Tax=Granulicella sp. L60 TaxID=1641866 RepID=UPI00131C98F3|nr:LpqB family beta-propeller domain-containing protein [Granulicella sp. L60]